METIINLLLLLSGLCSPSSCVPQHSYILVNMSKTWYEAQTYCRDTCFDLATINDMEEMETVLQAVEGKYDGAMWIGLQKGWTMRWHWSLANKDFYKEGEKNSFVLDDTHYNCVTYLEGKMDSISCTYMKYSVCFDGKKSDREQYVLTTQMMTWIVAREYCRTQHTDLASVRNEDENRTIQEVAGGLQVWIGLFRDPWEWSDQTDSSFRYWTAGQQVWTEPEQTCAALLKHQSGRWGELPCKEAHAVLCNCPIQMRFIKMRISSQDPELDPNDPAVHDYILKLIKQKLSDKSTTDVFQLRWKKHPGGRVFTRQPN
uniref:macrophage mannose receptor 1-like n=1 Tax=Scatophagus argus TaxID=75038 RepID=UPI001ED83382|nr:macrophage mannose receptor 1-like [Scatophagus argus]